ncbi:MAG: DUF4864 domain-containing protein [Gammaproteobacteria bacterium]|nr:DUF4864 domain-containing protein [Gammaproteobacteria bacterium]
MNAISGNSFKFLSVQGRARNIILGILAVIVVAIVLALYFTRGLADAAREQLSAIKSGDVTSAYNMTSAAFKQATSMDDFKKFVDSYPVLSNYKDVTFSERKVENGAGYLNGTIEGADGSQMKIEFQLVKEGSAWKVQAIQLSKAGLNPDNASKT